MRCPARSHAVRAPAWRTPRAQCARILDVPEIAGGRRRVRTNRAARRHGRVLCEDYAKNRAPVERVAFPLAGDRRRPVRVALRGASGPSGRPAHAGAQRDAGNAHVHLQRFRRGAGARVLDRLRNRRQQRRPARRDFRRRAGQPHARDAHDHAGCDRRAGQPGNPARPARHGPHRPAEWRGRVGRKQQCGVFVAARRSFDPRIPDCPDRSPDAGADRLLGGRAESDSAGAAPTAHRPRQRRRIRNDRVHDQHLAAAGGAADRAGHPDGAVESERRRHDAVAAGSRSARERAERAEQHGRLAVFARFFAGIAGVGCAERRAGSDQRHSDVPHGRAGRS